MDIIGELSKIINTKVNDNLTFYLGDIPIITVNFEKDRSSIIITNNMNELRYNKLEFNDDVDEFVIKTRDILIYSGVEDMVKKSKGSKIRFVSMPLINGEVSERGIIIEKEEVDVDNTGEEDIINKKYEINADIGLSGLTLANVIGAFALQFYV